MSTTQVPDRSGRPDRESKQRKRRARAPKARTPEPKDIVSGAGQPLDLGVRRELEERLGHDFSRVRVHTDRDAAALAQLLGADAVTVGEDIFFAEGTYRPGTRDGQRLLAHELLHTVQAPDGLGALRAGRDPGAVSLPQDAVEREAERGARETGRPEAMAGRPAEAVRRVTPGWLRYATVDADRHRTERLDPATLVDRLAAGILRSLRGDPTDASGRVRLQVSRLSPELQRTVLTRLERRLPSADHQRLLELVAESEERGPAPREYGRAPGPVVDTVEQAESERGRTEAVDEGEKAREEQLGKDAQKEKQQDAEQPEGEGPGQDGPGAGQGQDRTPGRAPGEGSKEQQKKEQADERAERAADEKAADKDDAKGREADQPEGEKKEQEEKGTGEDKRKEDKAGEAGAPKAAGEPGADRRRRKDDERKAADGSKQEAVGAKAGQQPGQVRPDRVDQAAEAKDSPLSQHGLNEKDEDESDPREEEQPAGLEADADKDVESGEGEEREADERAADATSARSATRPRVPFGPVSDEIELPVDGSPESIAETLAFTEPAADTPEQEGQDGESEPGPEEESEADDESSARPAPDREAPEGGRASEAERTPEAGEAPEARQVAEEPDSGREGPPAEQPVEQEVGPDPETTGKDSPEPEAEEQPDAEAQQDKAEPKAKEEQDEKDEDDKPEPRPTAKDETAPKATAAGTAPPAVRAPAGAQPAVTPSADRTPSPALRRVPEPVRGKGPGPDAQAAGPPPAGPVGGSEPVGPAAAAGPGAAPKPVRAAVSPAAEQQTEAPPGSPAAAKAAPEASLEKDGGGCAGPQQSTTEDKAEGGGSCGGGGSGAPEKEEKTEPPDVSGQDPKSALATVSRLPPDQARAALPGVDGAAEKSVGEAHEALEAGPPARERPSGAPQTLSGPPETEAPADAVTEKVDRIGPDGKGEQEKAKGDDKADGRKPTETAKPPPAPASPDGKVSAADVRNMQAAADRIPETDPELNKTVGPAPKVRLTGESDPERTDEQAEKLKETQGRIQETGREDAAKPMGEDGIFPDVPQETLKGNVSGGGGGGGKAQAGGPAPRPGVAVVAQQERGSEVQAAAGQAQGEMTSKEAEHKQSEAEARQQKQAEIDQEVADNAQAQAGERGQAAEQVRGERENWQAEQDKEIEKADEDSGKEHTARNKEIDKKRTDTDQEVSDRKDEDNGKIRDEREKAEKKAHEKKEEEKKDSGGFFGKLASAVGDFFKGLLEAVTAIFDLARKAVNGLIEGFKNFANKVIDAARNLAIDLINKLADALIAIGDVLLAAFPELRDRFRKKIEEWRDKAIAKVNEWADKLKNAVNKLLDALAAGLNKLLDVLEAGLKAAIDVFRAAIVGALEFAEKAIAALGKFAALVADIAPDPGGWLGKLGSSAKAGVQDHLWNAIKRGVKQWFDQKVEGILGLGKAVINALVKGCVSIKQIGKMAWDALVQSLPMMIVSIVIEKVISMIVPAAGAILTIVQGLVAAWGTISRIIAAFGKFFAYLKAVKAGPAACLFAEAVAAGVVALLDFITNFLMMRLKAAAKGVGKRLQIMAQKVMKGLQKAGKGARKAAGGAVNRARGAIRKAQAALAKPVGPARPRGAGVPPRVKAPAARGPGSRGRDRTTPIQRPAPQQREPDAREARGPLTGTSARRPDEQRERAGARTPDEQHGRRPQEKRDRQPDAQRPDKQTDPRRPDKQPDTPETAPARRTPKPPPKRPRPRRVTQALKRASKQTKKTVKNALTKVRNAGRTLGKKLRNSKVGRALRRSAQKIRNKFLKKMQRLRDLRRRLQQKRAQRRDRRKAREDQRDDRAEQETKRPTVKANFSMDGERHRIILKPAGDDVSVSMESELLPLQNKYQTAYNNIEYIKTYLSTIENEEVRRRFKEELLDEISDFQVDSVREYKTAFKRAFPRRVTELRPLKKRQEKTARRQVSALLVELRMMTGKISRWAARNGVSDFSGGAFSKAVTQKGEKIWKREYLDIKNTIDGVVNRFSYKTKPLEYVGSLRKGTRGPHKGRTAFNVSDFDVDLFVVHPEEWARIYPKMIKHRPDLTDDAKIFPALPYMKQLVSLGQRVGRSLAGALHGRLRSVSELLKTEIVLRKDPAYPDKEEGEE
ncbi:eCIS core domain-containing protein [Streptomyces sp. 8N706]|uniref:eCIS core domain-containing protein n=1 Tax=Streptomyces sp. 8N706 TaxID=3457416 RepID=UPI003FD089E1